VKDCDDYFAALETCSGKLPDAQRGPMQDELRKQKSAFDGADKYGKAQMRDTCRMGLATLKADQRCK
jgi:hypothetical protein